MNYRTRREALRTAAKVALSFSTVAACGGSTVPGADLASETELAPDQRADVPNGSPGVPQDASVAKTKDASRDPTPREVDAAPVVAETFAQCEARLATVVGDAGWIDLPVTPPVVSCCDTIIEKLAQDQTFATETAYGWQCCSLLRKELRPFPQVYETACMAWGPPMPPAFQDVDFLDEVA